MVRIALIVGLSLSLLLLVRGMTIDWQPPAQVRSEAAADADRPRPVPAGNQISLNPQVPGALPDLNRGYVFNEARSLSTGEEQGQSEAESAADVSIADVTYVGSVISDEDRIGIVSFPGDEAGIRGNVRRPGAPPVVSGRGGREYARLTPGESFHGFSVAEVAPEKIVFEKDGRKIEKMLLEPGKERTPPPPAIQRGGQPGRAAARQPPPAPGRAPVRLVPSERRDEPSRRATIRQVPPDNPPGYPRPPTRNPSLAERRRNMPGAAPGQGQVGEP